MPGTAASINVNEFALECDGYLRSEDTYVIARAPARLDVMGGIADAAGSLVLERAISCGTLVAAQARDDQRVHIVSKNFSEAQEPLDVSFPLSIFYVESDQLCSPQQLRAHFDQQGADWAKYPVGVLYMMLQGRHVRHLGGGLTLVIQSDVPAGVGIASSAALEVAVYRAVAALFDCRFEPLAAARICQEAENQIVGRPGGITAQVTAFLAEPDRMLQIKTQPHQVLGHLRFPQGITVCGIDSRVTHRLRDEKHLDLSVASAMGHRYIVRIINRSGQQGDPTNGYLANVTPTDFVDHFRDLIPTKIKGKEYLERFGSDLGPMVRVEPEKMYKVRSRTEHHIYENDRVHQFVERVSRAARTGERDALMEAGQLMYASHWSYSQRCGLGTVETDRLVNLVRKRGINAGLYGAKASDLGAGGTVVVLMNDTVDARRMIDEIVLQYEERFGLSARVFGGSSPGAMAFEPCGFNR